MWMPFSRLSTTAPNWRRMSRWKLIGRSPIRQPPRSGMNASPSRCSNGPQNRIGMRLEPACASMSATWALSTSVGSSAMTPAASSEVTRTPCSSSRPRTTLTSRIRGTLCSSLGPSPSSDATIALETKFLAPRTVISPCRGAPPWICMTSRMGPSSLTDGVRVTRSAPAGRRGLGSRVRATTYREPSGHDWSGCLDRHIGQVLGRKGAWPPRCPVGLELGDLVGVLQGQADVVEALHQAPAGVVVHLQRHDDVDAAHLLGRQVDGHLGARRRLEDLPDQLDVLLGELGGQEPLLAGVAAEDVGEPRGEHHTEPVVLQCPHGVLTRGAGAEVGARHQDGPGGVDRLVEDEGRVRPPRGEQAVLEAGTGDPLEVHGRDDLVGVDVAPPQRDAYPGVLAELLHGAGPPQAVRASVRSSGLPYGAATSPRSATDDKVPRMAVAAATSGDTRWVRPPLPCRPSKLRFDVEAARSPGASWSGFIPRHIEQPALRHSAPKSVKIRSSPSASACSRTRAEDGTTSTRTPWAFLRPLTTLAAWRRSSIRPLVHEPMNTVSTLMSRSGVPGSRPMYSRARSAATRSFSSTIVAGSGTLADSGRP